MPDDYLVPAVVGAISEVVDPFRHGSNSGGHEALRVILDSYSQDLLSYFPVSELLHASISKNSPPLNSEIQYILSPVPSSSPL